MDDKEKQERINYIHGKIKECEDNLVSLGKQEKEEEITKLQQGYNKTIKEIAQEFISINKKNVKDRTKYKGISMALAYHCDRCNYLWFPKDFDPEYSYPITGKNILKQRLPKVCARCKSKYWYSAPKKKKSNVNKRYVVGPVSRHRSPTDMMAIPRLKAMDRDIKRQTAMAEERLKFLYEYAKKRGWDLDKMDVPVPLPLPLITRRKKKKSIN